MMEMPCWLGRELPRSSATATARKTNKNPARCGRPSCIKGSHVPWAETQRAAVKQRAASFQRCAPLHTRAASWLESAYLPLQCNLASKVADGMLGLRGAENLAHGCELVMILARSPMRGNCQYRNPTRLLKLGTLRPIPSS